LRIEEKEPLQYRLTRDLVIDDLYSYLERTYDMRLAGGRYSKAISEACSACSWRGPTGGTVHPNLMVFRSVYTNDELRNFLMQRNQVSQNTDVVLDDFVREALAVRGEGALHNMAPYVTSKFNRSCRI